MGEGEGAMDAADVRMVETQARAEHERRGAGRTRDGEGEDAREAEAKGLFGAVGGLYAEDDGGAQEGEPSAEPAVVAMNNRRARRQGPGMQAWTVTQESTRNVLSNPQSAAAAAQCGFTPAYVANVARAFTQLGESLAQVHVLALDLCSTLADRLAAAWLTRGNVAASKGVKRAAAAYAEGAFADAIRHAHAVLRLHVLDTTPDSWRESERSDSCVLLLPLCAAAHIQLANAQRDHQARHAHDAVRCAGARGAPSLRGSTLCSTTLRMRMGSARAFYATWRTSMF